MQPIAICNCYWDARIVVYGEVAAFSRIMKKKKLENIREFPQIANLCLIFYLFYRKKLFEGICVYFSKFECP